MKSGTKIILSALWSVLLSLFINAIIGGSIAFIIGFDFWMGAIIANLIALFMGRFHNGNRLYATVLTEVWTGELIKAFRTGAESMGWYNRIRAYDEYAENDVIHFTEIGGDPKVLINNTSYPIGITSLEDADKAIKLDKFDTEATSVTDDELYSISYDKMKSVIERHKEAIREGIYAKAIHAIAPEQNTDKAPVLKTTGEADGNRKRFTIKDLLSLKQKFDKMKVPVSGRILVLCSEHINDLLLSDQKFLNQYNINQSEGKIARLYGFDIYEYDNTPYYTLSNLQKKAYGAVVDDSNDKQSSVAFYLGKMMKANGSTKMYYSESKQDPIYHRNLVNFRKRSICLPLSGDNCRLAIVSDSN